MSLDMQMLTKDVREGRKLLVMSDFVNYFCESQIHLW